METQILTWVNIGHRSTLLTVFLVEKIVAVVVDIMGGIKMGRGNWQWQWRDISVYPFKYGNILGHISDIY